MSNYPQTFLDLSTLTTKQLNVVVEIEDSPNYFSLVPTYKRIRYGDPDIHYGDAGLVYGGLKKIDAALPILSVDSNFVISQKVEPEQGRASASTFSLTFVDLDGFMSKFISPNQVLNEVLGGKEVKLWLGYANSSFKEDYFVFFRGYITSTIATPTKVIMQLTDANFKRKQQICYLKKTTLALSCTDVEVNITLSNASKLILPVNGPNGSVDAALSTCIRIDNEIMQYYIDSITGNVVGVDRGMFGTIPAPHNSGTEVQNVIFFEDNIIDLSLKIMLSGWGAPYLSNLKIQSFCDTNSSLGIVSNVIVLPDNVDAIEDYGLSVGDYVYVTGSTSNNGTYLVSGFIAINGFPNKGILTNVNLTLESTTLGVMALRSQYDVFPEIVSCKLRPVDVDVEKFQENKAFFFSQGDNNVRIYVDSPQSGKELIEKEMFLPVGAYSVTRFGRISMAVTKPPIADDRTVVLDITNVVEPSTIMLTRALNNRRFFNEIQYYYDYDIDGNYQTVNDTLDTNSLNSTIKVSSVLPIQSRGLRTDLGAITLISRRGGYLLRRFKDAAFEIMIKCNFQASSIIEVADVVAVYDNGELQITNLDTGQRNLGSQLFEVIEKTMDLKTGVSQLRLLGGLGFGVNDRLAGISPSSRTAAGSTSTAINIKESYGYTAPNTEIQKWTDFIGEQITIRSEDYTHVFTTTLISADPAANSYQLQIYPAVPFTVGVDYIVDVGDYPDTTNKNDSAKLKLFFSYASPSLPIVSGISDLQFTLSPTDAARIVSGQTVYIRNVNFSSMSNEVTVDHVTGSTVYLSSSLGLTPIAGELVEIVGYKDGQGAYLIL